MNPQLDLYSNIGEIRDTLDTLLKRGKPVSVADLQALVASVEAKSRPTLTFPASEAARLLAPQLLPLLPTPDNLAAAGKHAAARIEAALAAGTQQSIDQVTASVQESTRQLSAAAAALTKAAETVPRSVPVNFLQGWRWPTGLVLGPVALVLLGLWIGGAFSGVSQAKYDSQRAVAQGLADERDFYQKQIEAFSNDMKPNPETRKIAKSYFPKYVPLPLAETK
jgi:hypothetical protein